MLTKSQESKTDVAEVYTSKCLNIMRRENVKNEEVRKILNVSRFQNEGGKSTLVLTYAEEGGTVCR